MAILKKTIIGYNGRDEITNPNDDFLLRVGVELENEEKINKIVDLTKDKFTVKHDNIDIDLKGKFNLLFTDSNGDGEELLNYELLVFLKKELFGDGTAGLLYSIHKEGNTEYAECIGYDDTIINLSNTENTKEIKIAKNYKGVSVTKIKDTAFKGCIGIHSVEIPNTIEYIDYYAFSGCTGLTSVKFKNTEDCTSLTGIGNSAFADCTSLKSITIPDSVTSIGEQAFFGCTELTSVTIPDNVTSIGEQAFAYCTKLSSIKLPDNTNFKVISWGLFKKCQNLSTLSSTSLSDAADTITIPSNITEINSYAFSYCKLIKTVTLPDRVTRIGEYAFFGCAELTSITVDEDNTDNTVYKSIDGNLYSEDEKTLIQYATGKTATSFVIPDSVTSIGKGAFGYCVALTSVTIPDNVTSIDNDVFYSCSGLTSIMIPDNVTSIGDSAFAWCGNLPSVTIPDSVTEINERAFYGCFKLRNITIGTALSTIERAAFYQEGLNPDTSDFDHITLSIDRDENYTWEQTTSIEDGIKTTTLYLNNDADFETFKTNLLTTETNSYSRLL